MRLEILNLDFFGHFSGKQFDFSKASATKSDFHVIYGPNEAGKTTFMEAYLRLLYGFLSREPYDFIHQRKNLRVSGVLDIDGVSKTLVRLPSAKASLLDHTGTPVSESILQASLGGLSMQDYRNLLCIDDETIEKGGEEIVNSQGDIGTLLFSAAAGISDLSTVLNAVRDEADLLFKKGASRTQLAQLKSQLKDLDARIAEQDVSAAQFKKLKAQLKAADTSQLEVESERSALLKEQFLIQKQLEAMPLLHEIDEVDEALLPLAHFPQHLDFEQDLPLSLLPVEVEANADINRCNENLEQYKAELALIDLDEKQLSIAESLKQLQPLHAMYTTARLDLAPERRKLADAQQDMANAVRDFTDKDVDPVQLLISPALINELDDSVKNKTRVADELGSARASVERIKTSIAEKDAAMAVLTPTDDVSQSVSDILEKYNGQVFLAEFLATTKRVGEADSEVAKALDKLALKGQTFTSAPTCKLHSLEALELAKELETLLKDIAKAVREKADLAGLIEHKHADIARIQASDGIADDERISALKQERDDAWKAHRKDYLPDTADIFEASLLQHDKSMEGRVSNASTLGELRQLHQRVAEEQANEARLDDQIAQLNVRKESLESIFADAVSEAGLHAPVSVIVAYDWICAGEEAAAEERARDRIREEEAPILEKAERLHSALSQYIVREQATLQELMDAARDIDLRYRDQQKRIATEQTAMSNLQTELQRQTTLVEELAQSLEEYSEAWQKLVSASFPDAVDATKLEPVLNTLRTLRELDKDRVSAVKAVHNMEACIEQFTTEIDTLSKRMGVAVQEDVVDTYESLKALSNETLAAHTRQSQLYELIGIAEQDLAQAKTRLASNAVLKDRLAAHFDSKVPTTTINELISAEKTAREAIETRARRADAQKHLLQTLSLGTLDEARDQLAALDVEQVQVRVRELETDIKAADDKYHAAIEQRTLCKSALDAVVGDATVAELEQQRTTIELEMTDVALEHLKLSLGHKLAERAIMQYREKHRSGMMEVTESVFVELTNGAYSRLQSNVDGSVETLQVVQANGTAKSVYEPSKGKRTDTNRAARSDLSKGTRFQLYLALRAAAYEQLSSDGTCLPFICDDIFETFDEGRTEAACRVLQRIGAKGQAIYLTHHQHVVDIARKVCADDVSIHSLE